MINITILVHNRSKLTKQCLDSIGRFDGANITILADHCDVETWDVLLESSVWHTLITNDHDDLGTGDLRNRVIAISARRWGRGDYLYLSDNDVWFRPGWLPVLIECYKRAWENGYRVIGAYNHPFHHPVTRMECDDTYAVCEVNALATQSMLMKWEVWDQFGPFCKTPAGKVCQSEDVDFTNKIRAAGYRVGVVDPPLLVNTGITNSFGEKIPGWELVKAQCPEGILCE